ncbi:MAG: hypothetical protein SGJ20_11310 [Planctomycetota bacterium]|nr:hypothetical protein [Planctomycetota bacterium]
MNQLTQVLHSLLDILDRRQIEYALVGGLAVQFYGIPRPTFDIDLQMAISEETLPGVLQELATQDYEIPEPYLGGWMDRVAEMPVIKLKQYVEGNGIDVDLFVAERPIQFELIRRRRRESAEGRQLWLATAEDIILLKLIAHRPRDRSDVSGIIFMEGQLDETYLRHWAAELQVTDRLEEAVRDAASF